MTDKEKEKLKEISLPKLNLKTVRALTIRESFQKIYEAQTETPVVQRLLSDNGPEYKRITEEQGLCWIHEGRIYKKLKPVVPLYQDEVDKFLNDYWDYYENYSDFKIIPI